jgi:nuclear transport factor 2 (NTF2) superfamily protein
MVDHVHDLSLEEAEAFLREAEEAFATADVDRIVSAFHPDVVIRYADFPEMKGIEEARRWLQARFARQRNYRLRKTLCAVTANVLGGSWEGEWEDARTGLLMQGRGLEFQTLEDGKVVYWLAAFNAWSQDGEAEPVLV